MKIDFVESTQELARERGWLVIEGADMVTFSRGGTERIHREDYTRGKFIHQFLRDVRYSVGVFSEWWMFGGSAHTPVFMLASPPRVTDEMLMEMTWKCFVWGLRVTSPKNIRNNLSGNFSIALKEGMRLRQSGVRVMPSRLTFESFSVWFPKFIESGVWAEEGYFDLLKQENER